MPRRLPGSPPRLWGIRTTAARSRRWRAVHPHACGEYSARVPSVSRFTPTPVGNTTLASVVSRRYTVHPHACGEYSVYSGTGRWRRRFTPTPVGNTSLRLSVFPSVHGSPPRLWGILVGREQIELEHGSPPRLWGIQPGRPRGVAAAVHPHACGEYAQPAPIVSHVRFTPTPVGNTRRRMTSAASCRFTPTPVGNTRRRQVGVDASRFTPTPVGNTLASVRLPRPAPVHPHACGEYSLIDP